MAVRGASFDLFLDKDDVLEKEIHSAVAGTNVGVCQLDSGWAVKFYSGDCFDENSIQRLVKSHAPKSEFILVNMASSVMCSDFFWYVDSVEKCSVMHNGCDHGINDLRKKGRLPNGGRAIVDQAWKSQTGVTDVDYIYDIPALLAELKTGYRTEGEECEAKPIDGWRLLK